MCSFLSKTEPFVFHEPLTATGKAAFSLLSLYLIASYFSIFQRFFQSAAPQRCDRGLWLLSLETQSGHLPEIARRLESAMKAGTARDVWNECAEVLAIASDLYKVPPCGIRVLAVRPLRVRDPITKLQGGWCGLEIARNFCPPAQSTVGAGADHAPDERFYDEVCFIGECIHYHDRPSHCQRRGRRERRLAERVRRRCACDGQNRTNRSCRRGLLLGNSGRLPACERRDQRDLRIFWRLGEDRRVRTRQHRRDRPCRVRQNHL